MHKKSIYIASYYRPPNDYTASHEALHESLSILYRTCKTPPSVILAGDFNLPDINWENICSTNAQTAAKHNKLIEIIGEFGLTNMVNEPIRLDSGNILDLLLASNPSLISTINTVAGMSDHEAILFDINMNPTRNNKPPHKVYSYRSADWESLKSNCTELTKHYFDRNPDNLDVNSNWDFFHQNYTKLMSQSIPSRMTKQKHHLPWITRSIIRLQRKRDKAHSQAKKTKRNKHWETFKQLRKEVTKEVASSYSSYINNVIGENKQFWSFIRKNKSLKVNYMVKTTDSDKADALNDYFKSVFTKEQLPIPTKGPSPFPSIQSLEIGLNGVTKQLQALNPNKASGPDEIPAKVLKETANEISPIIHHIFQQSYTSGQLPEAWKTALVTAIYKKRQQVRSSKL